MNALIGNEWDNVLEPIFQSAEYQKLREFLKFEYANHKIYPDMYDIFNAFKLTPPDKIKVVILGQDPYINENQAHGLAFSVQNSAPPPSLLNIYKEIESDLGVPPQITDGSLLHWASQGVLLLNSVLTVRSGLSNSHKNKGWEAITSHAVKHLINLEQPIVFLLWGSNAQNVFYNAVRANSKHLVLKCPHPSPLSATRGFFGCKHFSQTNDFLVSHGIESIVW